MNDLTRNKIGYLRYSIGKWYENAKRDYGVIGNVADITYNRAEDTIAINFHECGNEYKCTIFYISEYAAQQLYDIWIDFLMEQEYTA